MRRANTKPNSTKISKIPQATKTSLPTRQQSGSVNRQSVRPGPQRSNLYDKDLKVRRCLKETSSNIGCELKETKFEHPLGEQQTKTSVNAYANAYGNGGIKMTISNSKGFNRCSKQTYLTSSKDDKRVNKIKQLVSQHLTPIRPKWSCSTPKPCRSTSKDTKPKSNVTSKVSNTFPVNRRETRDLSFVQSKRISSSSARSAELLSAPIYSFARKTSSSTRVNPKTSNSNVIKNEAGRIVKYGSKNVFCVDLAKACGEKQDEYAIPEKEVESSICGMRGVKIETDSNITNLPETNSNITNLLETNSNITNLLETNSNITNLLETNSNITNLLETSYAEHIDNIDETKFLTVLEETRYFDLTD